jgi:hypothetical protein
MCSDFGEESALPAMRQVRRVEPLHCIPFERQVLLIGKRPGTAVRQIPDLHHGRNLSAEGHCLRRGGGKLIQRSTLIRIDVRKRNVPKRRYREDTLNGLAHRCEQHARSGVEQQRVGIANQVLIEGEATRDNAGRHGRADPEDAVNDLVHTG